MAPDLSHWLEDTHPSRRQRDAASLCNLPFLVNGRSSQVLTAHKTTDHKAAGCMDTAASVQPPQACQCKHAARIVLIRHRSPSCGSDENSPKQKPQTPPQHECPVSLRRDLLPHAHSSQGKRQCPCPPSAGQGMPAHTLLLQWRSLLPAAGVAGCQRCSAPVGLPVGTSHTLRAAGAAGCLDPCAVGTCSKGSNTTHAHTHSFFSSQGQQGFACVPLNTLLPPSTP